MSRYRWLLSAGIVCLLVVMSCGMATAGNWQRGTITERDGVYYVRFGDSPLVSPSWFQNCLITWRGGTGRLIVIRPPAPEPPAPEPPAPQPSAPEPSAPEPSAPQPPAPQPPAPEPPAPQPPAPQPPAPQPPAGEQAIEAEMLQLVNQERARVGATPLRMHQGLVELARLKSKDMIDHNYFAHQSPTYGSPFDMIRGAGISYRIAGENLAGAPTLTSAHRGLMNSDGHRRNILNPAFTHVGIGVVRGGPYGLMFTQMFIGQ